MSDLDKLKDALAVEAFGLSKSDALDQGICVNCLEFALAKCYSDAGRREYGISGLCEPCFDAITMEPPA